MKYRKFFASIALASLFAGIAVSQFGPTETTFTTGVTPTNELIVELQPGISPFAFATANGLQFVYTLMTDDRTHVFATPSVSEAQRLLLTIREMPVVVAADNNALIDWVQDVFVSNDQFFFQNSAFNGFYGQWHLVNPYTPGLDAGVAGAWQRGVTGSGVAAVVVDDAVELSHEDLSPNADTAISWNFQTGTNNVNPTGTGTSNSHGTAVAGVAAARGGNTIGVTGAAPLATLGGIRILFSGATTANNVDAMRFASFGANTTTKLKNHSYGFTTNYVNNQTVANALEDSASAGTIHVMSAGNQRGNQTEDSNRRHLNRVRGSITAAALGSNGTFSNYSNFGACVTVAAPSNTAGGFGIVTTDRSGTVGYNGSEPLSNRNYTMYFGGTSSAAPLVMGVLTLVKEVQPALDVRFAKHLLARYSKVVHAGDSTPTSDGGWRTNSAGIAFNQNYGFGLIDANMLTLMAPTYSGVTPRTTETTSVITVNQQIPDNNPAGISRNFTISATDPLEEMEVAIIVSHPRRGDIEIYLTSPDGYTSRLSRAGVDNNSNINWTFMSNAFWGTNPAGQWTVRIVDTQENSVGTWTNFQARANMGTLIPSSRGGITWQNAGTGNVVNWYVSGGVVTGSQLIGVPPSTQWQVRAAGDMNNNGVDDIIWQNTTTGQVAFWYLDANGAVIGTDVIAVVGDPDWIIVDAAEMSGDSNTDLLWRNASTGLLVQWLMNGSGGVSSTRTVAVAPVGWNLRAATNMVGNSIADLLWQSTAVTGAVVIWEMNASGGVTNSITVGATGSAAWQAQGVVPYGGSSNGIVFQNSSTSQVVSWTIDGNGAVTGTNSLGSAPAGWVIRATGSF
ncbi:MAG: S8 family serine peptidase [Fimbriimonadaceae bacterium]